MNQTHPMELVRDFMRTYQQCIPERPALPDPITINLRYRLIDEEAQELSESTSAVPVSPSWGKPPHCAKE